MNLLFPLPTAKMQAHPSAYRSGDTVRVRISGDGAKFSRTSSFVLLSFAIINPEVNVLAGRGRVHRTYMY